MEHRQYDFPARRGKRGAGQLNRFDHLAPTDVDPDVVGNDMKILVTEMAGRASVELKAQELDLQLRRREVRTLVLGGISLILSVLIAIPIGVARVSAINEVTSVANSILPLSVSPW